MKEIKEGEFVNIFKMTNSQKEDVISKEIIVALRKKGGSETKRAILEYFIKNSEVITEEYIDFRRISKKSNREYSPFKFFFNFSLNYLERAEFLKKENKIYTLTDKGREANLEVLDFSIIYKNINKEMKREKNDTNFEEVVIVDEEEIVEDQWRVELIEKLKNFSPAKFEMFARKLVSKMNVEMDEKIGIQVSNDGGLDGFGYITSDDFRTARVAIQAKRWEGNVPSPEIDKFRGAMDKYNAEFGIFITTSKFSKVAIEASRLGTRAITLIDGDIIADLVAKYELYVKPVTTYVLDEFYDSE